MNDARAGGRAWGAVRGRLRSRGPLGPVARRVRDSRALRRLRRPAVSVVLPVYNVEQYLEACLDSILAQTMTDFEVVVVDDGSPDGSMDIARRYAARDRRLRLVRQPNGGLGAARNNGVRHARGRYLTFVDSDDVVPPDALRVLLDTARASGADVVVGAVERFDSRRRWIPRWVPSVHDDLRTGIRLEDFLPVLRNLYTWNKLFEREFFLAQDLWFREGVAYEDQPIITQLYVRARSIAIVPDVVYHYRARDDRSSISQQTATLPDLKARIQAWEVSREVLRREASRRVYDAWLLTLFEAHFHWYLGSSGTADDTYWRTLQAAMADFAGEAPPHVWDATMPSRRVLVELARQDRREEAVELARRDPHDPTDWPAEVLPGTAVVLDLPFRGAPGLPEELFWLRPAQLELVHSVEQVQWAEDPPGAPAGGAVCELSGWAFVGKIDLAEHEQQVTVVLRAEDGSEHRYPADAGVPAAFPPPREDAWCDHRPGSFHAAVPVHEVLGADAHGRAVAEVLLEVAVAGFVVRAPVQRLRRSGSAGMVPAAMLANGDRVVADWRHPRTLRLRLHRFRVRATDARLAGRRLSGRLEATAPPRAVWLEAAGTRAEARVAPDGSFDVALPLGTDPAPDLPREWRLLAELADGRTARVTHAGPMGPLAREGTGSGALVLERDRSLHLVVTEWGAGATADRVEHAGEDLVVHGHASGPDLAEVSLVLRHVKGSVEGPRAPVVDGAFRATVPLRRAVYRFGEWALPVGDHDLEVRLHPSPGGAGAAAQVPVLTGAALSRELPVPVRTERVEGRLVRGPSNGVRLVLVRPTGDARGSYRQAQLRRRPPAQRLHRGVLFRSYFGETATDNGVSIQRELARRGSDLPVYWAVQDHSVPVPEGGIPVVVNTEEYHDLRRSVAYYVDNMYQPEYHEKPAGQVLVQTFHGYPFKQMGHAHWRNLHFPQARIDSYDRRAADWDYLVSPARYATPLLVEHFAYPGEVLEIGYPRNDVLQGPEGPGIRAATRKVLGIAEDQTAVLYAPTFRDYLAEGDSSALLVDFLDYRAVHAALGDEVVVLARGHAFNAREKQRIGRLPGVVDVTDYPEVSDLYLAADVGVVDYSSLRFDFAVTGKPMVFQVPDLERYQQTRGWLLPFEKTAPGPLVATTDEVVDHLRDLPGLRASYAAAYDRFRADFLDLEDGRAGARFVDRVLVPRGDAPPDEAAAGPGTGS